MALLEGPADERLRLADQLADEMRVSDPCGLYYLARHLARAGHPRALSVLQRSVNGGFVCRWFLNEDPWLDAVRGEPGFDAIVEQATARIHAAREAFRQADGDRVLGLVGAASATGA